MMEDFDIIQRNFRFKPDEIFPRIKISLLVSLICESAFLKAEAEDKTPELAEAANTATSSYNISENE